jgi:predicted secreted protein
MAISKNDAIRVLVILHNYLEPKKALALIEDLCTVQGNQSFRESVRRLKELAEAQEYQRRKLVAHGS